MSSASQLNDIAVMELPYVSIKEKRKRNVKLNNKLTDELMREDIQIKDIMMWELKLIYIIHTEFVHGKGCLATVNLNKVIIDENKELYFNPSNKEFVSDDFNHPLRLMKTILSTHDEIYNRLTEVKHNKNNTAKIQVLKTISDYFYSFAVSTTINLSLDSFMLRCNHLAEMVDGGMIDVLLGSINL
jgi:hypothetical protein